MSEWIPPEQSLIATRMEYLADRMVETIVKLEREGFSMHDNPVLNNFFKVNVDQLIMVTNGMREVVWPKIVSEEHQVILDACPEELKHLFEMSFVMGFLTSQRAHLDQDEWEGVRG